MDYVPAIARWLHLMAGIMWVGLLYYFNFVQVAALKAASADGTNAGITKHVVPRALLYFRWAAVVTWLAGAALLGNQFVNAFTLSRGMAGIGVGAWLGTIMKALPSVPTWSSGSWPLLFCPGGATFQTGPALAALGELQLPFSWI